MSSRIWPDYQQNTNECAIFSFQFLLFSQWISYVYTKWGNNASFNDSLLVCSQCLVNIINMFAFQWVLPRHVEDMFCQWILGCKFIRGKILWRIALNATPWKLWLERNNRVFWNKSHLVEDIVESIVWFVALKRVHKGKKFDGVGLFDFNRCWAAIFMGGWRVKSSQTVLGQAF